MTSQAGRSRGWSGAAIPLARRRRTTARALAGHPPSRTARWQRTAPTPSCTTPDVAPSGAFEQLRRAAQRAASAPPRADLRQAVQRSGRRGAAAAAAIAAAVGVWSLWPARVEPARAAGQRVAGADLAAVHAVVGQRQGVEADDRAGSVSNPTRGGAAAVIEHSPAQPLGVAPPAAPPPASRLPHRWRRPRQAAPVVTSPVPAAGDRRSRTPPGG